MEIELYLIRHGETVDNVAGLYAGVRDSALTNYGHDQANRLGQHFANNDVHFTHIFSSPLSRAAKTAEAVQSAQVPIEGAAVSAKKVEITTVPELIEQDFGYYEGKPFHARTDPKKSGREAHRDQHKDGPGFKDVESKESMNNRADVFLNNHITPLFREEPGSRSLVVAVVSHGMLLSHLWRRLLLRLPPKSVNVNPEVTVARGSVVLQHLGGWSNTGYLELFFNRSATPDVVESSDILVSEQEATGPALGAMATVPEPEVPSASTDLGALTPQREQQILHSWSVMVRAIDRKDHLAGLKRQRGGIGSSAHDKGQKKLDGFFKRQRTS